MKPLFILLWIALSSVSHLFASENTIERVVISPKRVTFYCSAQPNGFTSELSPDKRKIILSFKNYAALESVRQTQGRKSVEDVYIQQTGKDLKAYIQLADRKGFTVVPTFYSKAIIIDIFTWDSLSPNDDNYRAALLGCERGITPIAEQNIAKAADGGNADAMVLKGISTLKTGNTDNAAQILNRAIELKTTLPDAFAALAQIARIQNKPNIAKRFQEEFSERSGVRSIIDIPVEYQPPSDSNSSEPISIAQQFSLSVFDDSLQTSIIADTTKISKKDVSDTTRFASLFQTSSSKPSDKSSSQSSMLDDWMKTSIMATIGFAVTASFYLAWLYFRWRKSKLNALIAASPAQKLDENFQTALSGETIEEPAWVNAATPIKAASLYKQGSLINMEINEDYEEHPKQEELPLAAKPDEIIEPLAWEKELDDEQMSWNEPPLGEMKSEVSESVVVPMMNGYFPPGEVELALHLQQEHMRQKSSALHSIVIGDIPKQSYELSKIAKKFGVEKNSLEVKRTLASLEQDSGAMKDLLVKFSGIINKQASALQM